MAVQGLSNITETLAAKGILDDMVIIFTTVCEMACH